ncbi:hypothetical protein [Mesorhizobium sp. A556]
MRHLRILALSASLVVLPASIALSETTKPEPSEVFIFYLRACAPQSTLSLIDLPPRDEGIAGAKSGNELRP